MTLAVVFWPRRFPRLPAPTVRLFEVEPGTRLLAHCHWQPERIARPTIILVHGLEGSSSSKYMYGIAEKAWLRGWNAVRLNQRNCGGTEELTPTLYDSGLSGDFASIVREFSDKDKLPELFVVGYSMGGNLVLKMAAEFAATSPASLRAVAAVSPSIDLASSANAFESIQNLAYAKYFLWGLKRRFRRKSRLFPRMFEQDDLRQVSTLRDFDDLITAPYSGYRDAADYYFRASAARVVSQIRIPALVLMAQDDPIIPFEPFKSPEIAQNPSIQLEAPVHGGHCGFITSKSGVERFWAEERVLAYFANHSHLDCSAGRKRVTPRQM